MALSLRRGIVVAVKREEHGVSELVVTVAGEDRPALGYPDLTGGVEPGDEVVVNTVSRDLELGSGGFDIVHVNLTRGLGLASAPEARAMKLNYTPLQHAVRAVEAAEGELDPGAPAAPLPSIDGRPVAVLALHGQLEPVAWAAAERRPHARVGYVQTAGGALPGALSDAVHRLRGRSLLAAHVTAAPAFGGEHEALTVAGALGWGFGSGGWDGAIVGPGPGIGGSATALGHGGLAALDSAHASLTLGASTVVVPRMSSGDPRGRHRGLSHHTNGVLELLLAGVKVAAPPEAAALLRDAPPLVRHEVVEAEVDLDGYRAAGLSRATMGRAIDEDELFFRSALAGGAVLGAEIDG